MKSRVDRGSIAATFAVLLSVGSSSAHHSTAAFDHAKPMTVMGTLTKVDWRNPHIEIFVEAKSAGRQDEGWEFEGQAPSWYRSRNVSKSDFERFIGQPVTIGGVRAKDGSMFGQAHNITFPDGKAVRTW